MVFIKKVGERVLVMNEMMEVVKEYPDSDFSVVGETLVIESKGTKALELPKSQCGILFL